MNEITIVGVDALHTVARDGRLVLRGTVSRGKLLKTVSRLPPSPLGLAGCVPRGPVMRGKLLKTVARLPPSPIGLESCAGAHEWARRFQSLGHTVRLTAP